MRGAGEHGALRVDQACDAIRRMVEAARQLRHFIPPFDLHADGEVSSTKGLDLRLQPFESSRDTPHNGIGPQRNGNGQQAKRSQQAQRAMRPLPAGYHKPSVWQSQGNRVGRQRRRARIQPGAICSGRGAGRRGADCRQEGAISTMYGEIDRQQVPEMLYCSL